MATWDPQVYNAFARERSAPFDDLLALVTVRPGLRVVDLGCGTGELTARLFEHLPQADVLGIDASASMLEEAAPLARPGLRFERARMEDVAGTFDLIFSNAALHWVDDHRRAFPALLAMLSPGGQLAVQMPSWKRPAAYGAIVDAARAARFREALHGYEQPWAVLPIEEYAELFTAHGARDVVALDKVYPHVLANADALADWQSGTALLPYRERLSPEDYAAFEAEVRRILRERYPQTPVFFPFRRTLLAATTPNSSGT